jgi:hypothetical protein
MNAYFRKVIDRGEKKRQTKRAEVKSLPKVPTIFLKDNYVNPITLNFPGGGLIVYQITDRTTGRKDYYDKDTFWKLAKRSKNNYWLLMADPKKPIPGLRNPMTRGNVYPRNVQRVKVKPAAKAIQNAVRRKLLLKKKK